LGVVVYTRVHTPRFCGERWSAGAFPLALCLARPRLISWLMVGIGRGSLRYTDLEKTELAFLGSPAVPVNRGALTPPPRVPVARLPRAPRLARRSPPPCGCTRRRPSPQGSDAP